MVEWTALEMRRTLTGTLGSNPSLSATEGHPKGALLALFLGALVIVAGSKSRLLLLESLTDNGDDVINLIAYGQCLGMVYNGSLGISNAGWFPPTDISGYTDTDAATAACYGDVDYVPYYYAGLGAEPSDIMFNVVASGGQIYVVYG